MVNINNLQSGFQWLLGVFGSKKASKIANSYVNVFDSNNVDVQNILKDLAVYCNFEKSSFNSDPYKMAFNEGARDVLLHILEMSNINTDKLRHICEEFNK